MVRTYIYSKIILYRIYQIFGTVWHSIVVDITYLYCTGTGSNNIYFLIFFVIKNLDINMQNKNHIQFITKFERIKRVLKNPYFSKDFDVSNISIIIFHNWSSNIKWRIYLSFKGVLMGIICIVSQLHHFSQHINSKCLLTKWGIRFSSPQIFHKLMIQFTCYRVLEQKNEKQYQSNSGFLEIRNKWVFKVFEMCPPQICMIILCMDRNCRSRITK